MTINLIAFDGDGIGPEIMTSTLEVIDLLSTKLSLDVNVEKELIGVKSLKAFGTTLPEKALLKSKEADGIILGPVDHNNYPAKSEGGLNPSGVLRIELDLFANIRPAKNYNNVESLSKNMDLIIVRENTEGFYADRNMVDGNGEFSPVEGVGLAFRKITKKASLRIAEEAFNIAKNISLSRDKKIKVHAIHKANVMRLTDGIFLDACRQISSKYNNRRRYRRASGSAAATANGLKHPSFNRQHNHLLIFADQHIIINIHIDDRCILKGRVRDG